MFASSSLFAVVLCLCHSVTGKPPNVLFIVADDLGWNDVGFHNKDMITPNIDKLAREGVILNQAYVQYVCSPSRNAFLTGMFPIHTGMQHDVIHPTLPFGLPTKFTLLPQHLKAAGYASHIVGKWHLGFCNWDYTPTKRGFDSFNGYYNGAEDYYTHIRDNGFDFRKDTEPDFSVKGTYSTFVFAERVAKVLEEHDATKPLFLYLPLQSCHAPLEVPQYYEDKYSHIQNKPRRTYCGMVTAMDEAIGNVTRAFMDKGLLQDTIIIFTADNGGPTYLGANNWPLRGAKTTLWEGGHRAASFVWGNALQRKGYTNNELIHAVDWFPTVLTIAGLTPESHIDGMNQWDTISKNQTSPRKEFIYNIDDLEKRAAVRLGDYKLIEGEAGKYNGWYPPPTVHEKDTSMLYEGWYPPLSLEESTLEKLYEWERYQPSYNASAPTKYQLYNVKEDPTERHDLSEQMPDIVEKLKVKLSEYRKTQVPALHPPPSKKSNPKHFGGVWSPGWC